jgi:hypothetical protein
MFSRVCAGKWSPLSVCKKIQCYVRVCFVQTLFVGVMLIASYSRIQVRCIGAHIRVALQCIAVSPAARAPAPAVSAAFARLSARKDRTHAASRGKKSSV